MAETKLNTNELNQSLIELGNLKWSGLNNVDLIGAVAKVLKTDIGKKLIVEDSNKAQILFAKLVWNESNESVRKSMLTQPAKWFVNLASNSKMTSLLTKALDAYTKNIGGGGKNPAAYLEIEAKVRAAKIKLAESKEDPFVEKPTAGELRMIEKFDRLAAANTGPREEHHPNENAVTYPFILGKVIMMAKINLESISTVKRIVTDMFKYISVHGQKTVKSFNAAVNAQASAKGPESKVDIMPFMRNLLTDSEFITASDANASNKLLENSAVTLKRIIRLIHICTPFKTAWGLMEVRGGFVDQLVIMNNLEGKVNSPDMNSLSMIWYLCIGRGNMCAIMVDHWEESASNNLAKLLKNKKSQAGFEAPEHVFPLDKPTSEKFSDAELGTLVDIKF